MKIFRVSFGSHIPGSYDSTIIIADNSAEALEKGKSILNRHKLVPDFLNQYSRYKVEEIISWIVRGQMEK